MNEQAVRVAIVRAPADQVAYAGPAVWAAGELTDALQARGITVEQRASMDQVGEGVSLVIVAAGTASPAAQELGAAANVRLPTEAEALALVPAQINGMPVLLAAGTDARGLVYALLELADRLAQAAESDDLVSVLSVDRPIIERPANPIRGVARLQVSDVEDLPWFRDREGWQRYLTMLATHRYNRVHLAFGIGHDFLRNVLDSYLLFPYPFLIGVPGQDVRAIRTADGTPLPDEERDSNLDTLRYISDEAARRGLHFQLGIWTQQYQWTDSPNATYVTEGLNADNHAEYCRDALRGIVEACPGIAGVTLRVHGESGVPEGNYDFWRTVYSGLTSCSRRVDLDLHPKGVDHAMIEVALETGLPISVSPKYTAEHMGLPGHQAAIRPTEAGHREIVGDAFMQGLMSRSHFDLAYTRYGYADFLEVGRPYGVYYRVWPGTQRLLMWGNPAFAAGYGRNGSIGGSLGVEFMEPLSFKGRRGSGLPGGRNAYADESLKPAGGDWEKYRYSHRLFGRLLYNPDADPESWRRYLRHEFGEAAASVETALAQAGRILPLVTTAHHPSAANNRYWPEIYTNMPIVENGRFHPYRDTEEPRRFGNVRPHDPETFSSIEEFADGVVGGQRDGRYSPLRVAEWLTASADAAKDALEAAERLVSDQNAPSWRRMAIDVRIQIGLGRFFAEKLRAGVGYALFKRTGLRSYLEQAVQAYQSARDAWLEVIEDGRAYRDDITVGGEAWLRGHWADRLPAIEDDLGDMTAELTSAPAGGSSDRAASSLVDLDPLPPAAEHQHTPPASFTRGEPLELTLAVTVEDDQQASACLRYRHLNQAEAHQSVEMTGRDGVLRANIPAEYTDSAYPLMYAFEVRTGPAVAWRYPGLCEDLANQPYFVVRQEPASQA